MKLNIFGDVNVLPPPKDTHIEDPSGIIGSLAAAESTTVSALRWVLLSDDLPYAADTVEVVDGRGCRGNGWDPRLCCAPQAGIVRLHL